MCCCLQIWWHKTATPLFCRQSLWSGVWAEHSGNGLSLLRYIQKIGVTGAKASWRLLLACAWHLGWAQLGPCPEHRTASPQRWGSSQHSSWVRREHPEGRGQSGKTRRSCARRASRQHTLLVHAVRRSSRPRAADTGPTSWREVRQRIGDHVLKPLVNTCQLIGVCTPITHCQTLSHTPHVVLRFGGEGTEAERSDVSPRHLLWPMKRGRSDSSSL